MKAEAKVMKALDVIQRAGVVIFWLIGLIVMVQLVRLLVLSGNLLASLAVGFMIGLWTWFMFLTLPK